MSARPRHTIKELEAVLKEAEDKGWRVTKDMKYFKMWCPCKDKHRKTVHLSPSDKNYERNLRAELGRRTCWTEEAQR
jgi:hypothetical protein